MMYFSSQKKTNMKSIFLLIVTFFAFNYLQSQALTDGLLLYYPLNGEAVDLSGNNFDGYSTAIPGADRFGNLDAALEFNGVNQFVSTPNDPILKPELPVTISLWVYARSLPESPYGFGLFANDDTTHEYYTGVFIFLIPTGQINVSFGDGGITTSTSRRTLYSEGPITLNEWHHVICTVNGPTDMAMFIDCVDVSGIYEGTGSSMVYSNANGSLGRRKVTADPYVYFDGFIDEVAFWDRQLSSTEILDVCQGAQIVTAIDNQLPTNDFINIFPNPASALINISGIDEGLEIQIIDIFGRVQKHLQFNYGEQLDVSTLTNGIYFIEGSSSGEVIGKIVVQH